MAAPRAIRDSLVEIERLLAETYGTTRWRRHDDPLSELVSTVLSQHTSDTNTARAFASLRATFGNWEEIRTAPVERVEAAIRSGGLAHVKATRIQRLLDALLAQFGHLSLDDLESMDLERARAFLVGLPGVGPKTTACVLLFSLGMPALPVDTHVHRVALRLGLIPPNTSAEAAHQLLEPLLGADRDRVYAFHMNPIAHGRAICRARNPLCHACPLKEHCDYFLRSRRDRAASAIAPSSAGGDGTPPGAPRSDGGEPAGAVPRRDRHPA